MRATYGGFHSPFEITFNAACRLPHSAWSGDLSARFYSFLNQTGVAGLPQCFDNWYSSKPATAEAPAGAQPHE